MQFQLYLRELKFQISSNHGGQFTCNFSYLKAVNLKFSPTIMENLDAISAIFEGIKILNFLQPWRSIYMQFQLFEGSKFQISSNHDGQFTCNVSYLRELKFQIFFNCGGQHIIFCEKRMQGNMDPHMGITIINILRFIALNYWR